MIRKYPLKRYDGIEITSEKLQKKESLAALQKDLPKLRELLKLTPQYDHIIQFTHLSSIIKAIEQDDASELRSFRYVLMLAESSESPYSEEQRQWIANFAIITDLYTNQRARFLVTSMTTKEVDEIAQLAQDFINMKMGGEEERLKRATFVQRLFSNESDYTHKDLVDILRNINDRNEYDKTINHPLLVRLFELVSHHPWKYPYEAAFLGNLINGGTEKLRQMFAPTKVDNLQLSQSFKSWWLCSTSEYRLLNSAEKQMVVLITDKDGEPLIAVKLVGKFCGITLKSLESENGVIIPVGTWISPTDNKTRQELRDSFDDGVLHYKFDHPSEWAIMRGVEEKNMDEEEERPDEPDKVTRFWKKLGEAVKQTPVIEPSRPALIRLLYQKARSALRQQENEGD